MQFMRALHTQGRCDYIAPDIDSQTASCTVDPEALRALSIAQAGVKHAWCRLGVNIWSSAVARKWVWASIVGALQSQRNGVVFFTDRALMNCIVGGPQPLYSHRFKKNQSATGVQRCWHGASQDFSTVLPSSRVVALWRWGLRAESCEQTIVH